MEVTYVTDSGRPEHWSTWRWEEGCKVLENHQDATTEMYFTLPIVAKRLADFTFLNN